MLDLVLLFHLEYLMNEVVFRKLVVEDLDGDSVLDRMNTSEEEALVPFPFLTLLTLAW